MISTRSSCVLIGVAALVAASCGGSDDGSAGDELSTEDLELAAAVTADLTEDDDQGFGAVFDVECMGTELVRALGGAEAAEEKYGFTPETAGDMDETPMERADAERVVTAYQQCGDFSELLAFSFESFGTPPDVAQCVVDEIPEELILESITAQLTDPETRDPALDEALGVAAVTCGS